MSRFRLSIPLFFGLALTFCSLGLRAADFEIGSVESSTSSSAEPTSRFSSTAPNLELPVALDLGDLPTAYAPVKYGLRADLRFHDGGGILAKVHLGIFTQLFIGGALNTRNVIGSGIVTYTREDAQALARLILLTERGAIPALAVGWDGPRYERGEAKGLYAVVSKTLASSYAQLQLHGGANTAVVEQFQGDRDLRAFGGASVGVGQFLVYSSLDEGFHPAGPRWDAGLTVHFNPIYLGLEFRDLSSVRNLQPSRLLRVGYDGHF